MKDRIKQLIKNKISFLYSARILLMDLSNDISNMIIIKRTQKKQNKALLLLKGKRKIKCVFFVLRDSVWKYDPVFKIMQQHPRFEPLILVCPIVNFGRESMIQQINATYEAFKHKGYNVIKAYDEKNNSYVDVKKSLDPDIIFYTNPYKSLIDSRYYITNYLDTLSIYVHYGYNSVSEWDFLYKKLLTNIAWRYYVESPLHLSYVQKYSYNKGKNCVITGYPGVEDFMDGNYIIKENPWKINSKESKRIIWAPHHTIGGNGLIHFSTFLRYADFMVEIAKQYSDKIQIAFKPHPMLRDKLVKLWGKERTDTYYNQWATMPNTILANGEYTDLFLTSDAMIHDSGSFLIEYLYVQKPVMRLMNGDNVEAKLNSFAKKCLDVYYKGYNEEDIQIFVNNVISGTDDMKVKREQHYVDYLQSYKGKLPSQNIIDDILESIDNQILYRN